jgi:hypothetical protein
MNIEIPFAKDIISPDPLSASVYLDTLSRNYLNNTPWPQFNSKPDVCFTICYTDESILLKYYVKETSFQALYKTANDPVYRDSCVEFFIAFDDDGYYNLEFNSIGTCLASFGKERSERRSLPKEVIDKIKYQSLIKTNNADSKPQFNWELTLIIPFQVFQHHALTSLKNKVCTANFYKCGDDLPQPHFVTWNNITSEEPDFHLPQFFGKAEFI